MGKILYASGSGYFPSCIEEVSSIQSNFKSTLRNMMSVYWRVSQWKAKVSGTAISRFDEPIIFFGTEYNLNRTVGPSTEEELIFCEPQPLSFITEGFPIVSVDGVVFNGNIFLSLDLRISVQKEAGDSYSIASGIGAAVFPGSLVIVDPIDPSYDLVIGSCRINMAVGFITTPLFASSDYYKSGNVQLTFTAREYYSYGGTYNTQTG
jgi:hypothetical protein